MTPEQRNFFRELLHSVLQGGLLRVMWGMPWLMTLIVVLAVIAAIVYFQLY